jgi:hypothetical protein
MKVYENVLIAIRQITRAIDLHSKYLAKKYGPDDALRRFVRQDGSELTLDQLKARYPDVKPRTTSSSR